MHRLDHGTASVALDRAHVRKMLQRAGVVGETGETLPSDSREVRELLADPVLAEEVGRLAEKSGLDAGEARALAAGYLRSMSAAHTERAGEVWRGFASWMTRAHDFIYDEEAARKLRALDRKHSLFFLFSHRSYLDVELSVTLNASGIEPAYFMGGANLDFFPFGAMARKVGIVFIRRDTSGLPIYRLMLRSYIGQLTRNRKNIAWAIEGGRSRTGKLRPPAYGILRYVVDAIEAAQGGPEALIIPVSFVYEQLHEVGTMTSEARGGKKRPEDLRWLVNFAKSQGDRLGHAYLDFGEPLPVRKRLAELRAEDPTGEHLVERLALDTCHRINQATPVTATAVVCVALLAVNRALTLDEVLDTVRPLAQYIADRKWPVAGAANLTDRATIRRTMQELVRSSVLVSYDGGMETVWSVGPQQHLVAAFYRNTAIHILVDRAIGELALLAATESPDAARTAGVESLRLRDLLKFDFFFPSRSGFIEAMRTELALLDPAGVEQLEDFDADQARAWLSAANPLISHLVMRPFLDAYNIVADRLVDWEDSDFDDFDEKRFLDECLRVGRQWALQRKVASEESVSLELFKPALELARHRGLVASGPQAAKGRADFADEVRDTVRRVNQVAAIARAKRTV